MINSESTKKDPQKKRWELSIAFGTIETARHIVSGAPVELTPIETAFCKAFALAKTERGAVMFDAFFAVLEQLRLDSTNPTFDAYIKRGMKNEAAALIESKCLRIVGTFYFQSNKTYKQAVDSVAGVLRACGYMVDFEAHGIPTTAPALTECTIRFQRQNDIANTNLLGWLDFAEKLIRAGYCKDERDLRDFIPSAIVSYRKDKFNGLFRSVETEYRTYLLNGLRQYGKTRILVCPLRVGSWDESEQRQGNTGTGKSECILYLANRLKANSYHWINATKDVLSESAGALTLILDEYNGGQIPPANLLGMFDKSGQNFVGSRNRNRNAPFPVVALISKKEINELRTAMQQAFCHTDDENISQFFSDYRRLSWVLLCDQKTGWIFAFDKVSDALKYSEDVNKDSFDNDTPAPKHRLHIIPCLMSNYGGGFDERKLSGCARVYEHAKVWEDANTPENVHRMNEAVNDILANARKIVATANVRIATETMELPKDKKAKGKGKGKDDTDESES